MRTKFKTIQNKEYNTVHHQYEQMLIINSTFLVSMDREQLPAGDENHCEWTEKYSVHTHHTYNAVTGLLLFRIAVT